jgi:hypothetical protein
MPDDATRRFLAHRDRSRAERAARIADAKAAAGASKEELTLDRIDALVTPSAADLRVPADARLEELEHLYYVVHPRMRTVAELAAHLLARARFDG